MWWRFSVGLVCALCLLGCARTPEQRAAAAVESLLEAEQPAAAAEAVERCLQQYPQSARLRHLQVLVLLRLERFEPAMAALRNLLDGELVLTEGLEHQDPVIRASTARLVAEQHLAVSCRQLLRGVEDAHPLVRRYCAQALGDRPECETGRALYRLLQDDQIAVRLAAVQALGRRREPRAPGWLVPLLATGDETLQAATETALAETASRDWLRQVYRTAAPARQFGVAVALAKLGDPTGLPVLLPGAKQGKTERRCRAVRALGECADAAVLEWLAALMADPEPRVQDEAKRAWAAAAARLKRAAGA